MNNLSSTKGCRPTTGRTFDSGAKRNNAEGKGRYDLIIPAALEGLAKRLEEGANAHGEFNFMLGIPNSSLFDSTLRHINQARLGCTDEPHLIAAFTNIMFLIHNQEHGLGGVAPITPKEAKEVIEKKETKLC